MTCYEPLHHQLCRFVQALVWNKEEAKDIISETIVITFERFDKIKDQDAMLSYLFSVAANLAKQKLRRKKFWFGFDESKIVEYPDNITSDSSLIKYELSLALSKLNATQREAIVWFEINGLSKA